jgi:hypothetical protein
VAAVTSGDLPDINLAVSSALGSGLFITTVILGAVILSSSTKIVVKQWGLCKPNPQFTHTCSLKTFGFVAQYDLYSLCLD